MIPFQALRYDRVCRTPSSEAYLLSDGDELIGRVDLHFGASVVHGLLVLERDVAEDLVRRLVEQLDDDLVATADQPREDFVVTVYQGAQLMVISDEADDADTQEPLLDEER